MNLPKLISKRKQHLFELKAVKDELNMPSYLCNKITHGMVRYETNTTIFDYRLLNKAFANIRVRPTASGRDSNFEHALMRISALLIRRIELHDTCTIWKGEIENAVRCMIHTTCPPYSEEPEPTFPYHYNPGTNLDDILSYKSYYNHVMPLVMSNIMDTQRNEAVLNMTKELLEAPYYESNSAPLRLDAFDRWQFLPLHMLLKKELVQLRSMQTSPNPVIALTGILTSNDRENVGEYTESYIVALAAIAAQLPGRITDEMLMRAVLDMEISSWSWQSSPMSLLFKYLCWTNQEERLFQYLHDDELEVIKPLATKLKEGPNGVAKGKLVKIREVWRGN